MGLCGRDGTTSRSPFSARPMETMTLTAARIGSPITLGVVACAADVVLFYQRAGALLLGWRLVVIVGLGVAAVILIRRSPHWWTVAIPVLSFEIFRTLLVDVIPIPKDAVLRDAQAGIAVAVIVGGQLALVAIAVALAPRGDRG